MTPPMLVARVEVSRGSLSLLVELAAAAGQVVVLLGPNGAGKSTTLRALAGLTPLTAGRIALDGQVLDDVGAGVFVPPERRPIGLVHQDPLLFPHLSVRDNVAFGVRARGADRAQARRVADGWLERMRLSELATVRPSALSGGQAQQVALARALAAGPHLLLLDEPLAALDVSTRSVVRTQLREHLTSFGGPSVLVTHDPLDALVLADQLVVVEAGRVVQAGPPSEVARQPHTDFVARLVGLNLYRGTCDSTGTVQLDGGGVLHAVASSAGAGPALVALRPGAVALHSSRPEGSPRNVWSGTVAGLELLGDRVRVAVEGSPSVLADVTAAAVADLGLRTGLGVWISVKANDLEVYRSAPAPR